MGKDDPQFGMRRLTIKEKKRLNAIIGKNSLVALDDPESRRAFLKELEVLNDCSGLELKGSTEDFVLRLKECLVRKDPLYLDKFLWKFLEMYGNTMSDDDRKFLGSLVEDGENTPVKGANRGSPPEPSGNNKENEPHNNKEYSDNPLKFLMGFIREAMQAVPAVKWALGVGGVAAVFALVSMPVFGLERKVAFIGVTVMFLFMGVMVIFAKVSKLNIELQTPAKVFTWFSLFLFMITSTLLMTSAFFGWPRELARLFSG